MSYRLFVIFTEAMDRFFEWLTKEDPKVTRSKLPYVIPKGESLKDKL